MRKIVCFGMLLLGMTATIVYASEVFTYTPDPADVFNLDHYKWYTWGIDVSDLDGRIIEEVELRFEDITNYNGEDNVLYLHLLDSAPLGLTVGDDDQSFDDHFDSLGPLIAEWEDTNGGNETEDLSFFFSELGLIDDTQDYVLDMVLGIGLDPDCHFYNEGVSLIITASGETAAREQTWSKLKDLY